MAKDSFSSYIQKNQNKYINRQEQIQKQQDENAQLSSILDEMAVNSEKYETGSYSKQEVAEAAKSILRAQPYDVDITHMDLTDNAVYYNTETNKSRGRFSRKSIRDYGKMMIEKAKVIREDRKKAAEEEARQQKIREEKAKRDALVLSSVEGMTLPMENITIEGEWQREAGYAEKEAGFLSTDMFSKFSQIPAYSEKLQGMFQGELGAAMQERVKTTLSADIPPYEDFVAKLNTKMQSSIKNFAQNKDHSEEDVAKQKTLLMAQYTEKQQLIEKRYRDVKEGRVSPEAFKLFLDTTLLTFMESSQNNLYKTFVSSAPDKMVGEAAKQKKKESEELKAEFDAADRLEEKEAHVTGQPKTEAWKKQYLKKHPYKAAVDKIAQMYKTVCDQDTKKNIPQRKAFLESGFVQFTGDNFAANTVKKRFYVTCKENKHADMLEAWAAVLERNKDLSQRLKFKFGGDMFKERKDNIVIYVPENVTEEEMNALMTEFSKECEKNKVLADGKDSMETAGKFADGIGVAPEFPVSKYLTMVLDNGLNDQNATNEFYKNMKAIAKKEGKKVKDDRVPDPGFSYNQYLTKAVFLAHSIVRQKHGIGPEGSIDGDEAMMKEVTSYFNDFIRLAGVDPATFDQN